MLPAVGLKVPKPRSGQADINYNMPADAFHPANAAAWRPGEPPAEGLLGGQVQCNLWADPRSLTGTVTVIHPNTQGCSVFNVHCTEVERLDSWEPQIQSQRTFLAMFYNYPLPARWWNGEDGSVPRSRPLQCLDGFGRSLSSGGDHQSAVLHEACGVFK